MSPTPNSDTTPLAARVGGFSQWSFLLSELVKREFKNKYNRSVLGMLWCLLEPILLLAILYMVFSIFFRSSIENFALYLIIGITFYSFFTTATSTIMRSLISAASLITRVHVPLMTYPLAAAIVGFINFLVSLIPLVAVLIASHVPLTLLAPLVIFPMICMFFLSLGVGLVLAPLAVYFKDVLFLWQFVCRLLMYATPIFYPVSRLSPGMMKLFYFNPLFHNITFARDILMHGTMPSAKAFLACAFFAAFAFALGLLIFKSQKGKFARYL